MYSFTLLDDFSNYEIDLYDTLSTDCSVQIRFDISSWLSTDTIASVTFKAFDELGTDVTATVLDAGNSTFTLDGSLRPWIKGGSTNKKQYTVAMKVTTNSTGEVMTFYLRYRVKNIGQR